MERSSCNTSIFDDCITIFPGRKKNIYILLNLLFYAQTNDMLSFNSFEPIVCRTLHIDTTKDCCNSLMLQFIQIITVHWLTIHVHSVHSTQKQMRFESFILDAMFFSFNVWKSLNWPNLWDVSMSLVFLLSFLIYGVLTSKQRYVREKRNRTCVGRYIGMEFKGTCIFVSLVLLVAQEQPKWPHRIHSSILSVNRIRENHF